jgi:hypothetical protein
LQKDPEVPSHQRGAYPRVNSKENPHSQQKAHQENKSASNGCKSRREEGVVSLG